MDGSKISIIVPTYNRADIIGETISSILAQDYKNWELIIVDDGSTDSTPAVVDEFCKHDQRISFMVRPAVLPKGANACRNYGFSLSTGKYVKWVDSDDLLTPNALSSQVAIMESDAQLRVCFGQGIFFNAETRVIEERWSRKVYPDNMLWDYIRNQIRWPVGGPLWRRDHFEDEPFHLGLKNSQEWLMHALQIIKLKPSEYRILDDTLYHIRRGNLRMSSRVNRNSAYFYNEFKARVLLYDQLLPSTSVRIRVEVIKQMAIYYFHSVRAKIRQ